MIITVASFGSLAANYPRRDKQDAMYKDVDDVMSRAPGTPCCVQMSRAFGGAGIQVPRSSYRRVNERFTSTGLSAILAVDEVEEFLTEKYGPGENVKAGDKGDRSPAEIKKHIAGRKGVLLFRQRPRKVVAPKGEFEHTELWDGAQILQRDMAEDSIFSSARVLLWETNDVPAWLKNYMGA